jgi:hypothetical protein
MLLTRLVASAVVAAAVSAFVPVLLLIALGLVQPDADPFPVVSFAIASPIGFAAAFILCDYLLVRGRLATAVGLLTWAGRIDAAELRALTRIRRATDRDAAARWLAEHPPAAGEPPSIAQWRVSLQILVGDLEGARASIAELQPATSADALAVATTQAQLALAGGQGWNAGEIRQAVAALPNGDKRAHLAVEAAALEAQAAWTCGGDHLAPLAWAEPLVGNRAKNTLVLGYWVPLVTVVLLTSLALALFFGSSA